jgi:uncharacterized protein (DUF433 family)
VAEILAFSAWHACRLTGLTMRQLGYWDRTGFFSPSYAEGPRRSAFTRVYSFRDVVGLRALAEMRNKHQIPLQQLRQVGAYLSQRYNEPWSTLTFYIVGRRVFYQEDQHQAIRSADRRGQTVLPFTMRRVANQVTRAAARLQSRRPREIGRITRNRYIAENQAVLAGTRVPTRAVWDFHEAGYSDEQILAEYPSLTKDDIHAAVKFEASRATKAG